jgi:bacterial leucyl aminopeptidase
MHGLNNRVQKINIVVAITTAALAACNLSTGEPELADADRDAWIVVGSEVADEVTLFLEPTDGESRIVSSQNDRVIVRVREGEIDAIAGYFHDTFRRCGGFTAHSTLVEAATALTDAAPDASFAAPPPPLIAAAPDVVNQLIPLVSASQIASTINSLTAFGTRHYRSNGGVQAANSLRARWATLAQGRAGATATLFAHSAWPQPSVMLTIPGTDLASEVVVIGGHLDTINGRSTNINATAPGADDDASGVATLTEVARLILSQNIRLRRTVTFMAYAGEEAGLRGSSAIANDFRARNVRVAGVMQLDMTNFDGSPHDIVLITDNVSAAQTDFLAMLAARYVPQFPVSRDRCGYACSDHASWTRAGYPAVLPFEATLTTHNPNIHTVNDTLSVSGNNANHAAKFAKLAIAYVVEMAQVPAN